MNRWTESSQSCDSLGQLLLWIRIKKRKKSAYISATSICTLPGHQIPYHILSGKALHSKEDKEWCFPRSSLIPLRTPPAAVSQLSKPAALLCCAGWCKHEWLPSVLERSWVWAKRSLLATLQNSRWKMHCQCTLVVVQVALPVLSTESLTHQSTVSNILWVQSVA